MPDTKPTAENAQPIVGAYEMPAAGEVETPAPTAGVYEPAAPGAGVYEPPASTAGVYEPAAPTAGVYEPPAYGAGAYETPAPTAGVYEPAAPGAGVYEPPAASPGRPPASSGPGPRPTPVDYVIGGTSILRGMVAGWQESGAPTLEEARLELDQERPVLLPESQWEAIYGPLHGSRARYAAIGLALSAAEGAKDSGGWIRRTANTFTDKVAAPVYHSWPMAPIRRRVDRLAGAGEAKVDQWAAIGRAREQRSVLLTQASVQRLADQTLEVINEGPVVKQVVREVVQAQSQNLTRSFLDELREHVVTLDLAVEHRIRRLLRRPAYPTHASPEYPVALRGQPFDKSLLGDRPFLGGQFAGFVSRAAAFAVDIFLVVAILAVGGMFYTALTEIFFIDRFFNALVGADTMETIRAIVAGLAGFVVAAGYWLLAWTLTGETVGHAIMGVRVLHRDGKPLNFWQALRRLFGYFVSALPLGLGFLWVLIDNRRDGWHDKIASSDAIYIWQARPDESFLSREVAQLYQAQKIQNAAAEDGR